MKFLEKYEHRNSCREFIDYFSDYLFNKDVKNKLLTTKFIGVLNDGTTDSNRRTSDLCYLPRS